MPGSLLEQPLRVVLLGDALCGYADAFATFQANGDKAPEGVKKWVLQIMAASAVAGRS